MTESEKLTFEVKSLQEVQLVRKGRADRSKYEEVLKRLRTLDNGLIQVVTPEEGDSVIQLRIKLYRTSLQLGLKTSFRTTKDGRVAVLPKDEEE